MQINWDAIGAIAAVLALCAYVLAEREKFSRLGMPLLRVTVAGSIGGITGFTIDSSGEWALIGILTMGVSCAAGACACRHAFCEHCAVNTFCICGAVLLAELTTLAVTAGVQFRSAFPAIVVAAVATFVFGGIVGVTSAYAGLGAVEVFKRTQRLL